MRNLLLFPILLILSACTGGTPEPAAEPLRIISATITPELAEANEDMRLAITYSGGRGPYEFKVGLAGPTAPVKLEMTREAGTTTAVLHFTAPELTGCTELPFTATILATDASEAFAEPAVVHYAVLGTGLPPQPVASYNAATGIVTIAVSDPDGDDVTVTPTTPPGFVPLAPQTVSGGNGTVDFLVEPADIIAGASGDVLFTVNDGTGGMETTTVHVDYPPLTLAPDTLYAIPLQRTVRVGEPVLIAVLSGDTADLLYSSNVTICAPRVSGYHYEHSSLNGGAPGGDDTDADGIWYATGATELFGSFGFWAEEGLLSPSYMDGELQGWGFLIEPIGGAPLESEQGMLLNFQATFNVVGTWKLSFASANDFSGFPRTAYRSNSSGDVDVVNHFWSDISNDHPGIPNSVTVIP